MRKIDFVESWLNAVSFSHSGSSRTTAMYRCQLQKFLNFIGKTPDQIFKEYERYPERKFKLRYAQYIKALIGNLQSQNLAPASITNIADAIKSFFKYSDFPLGFVPRGSRQVVFHNKDISHVEVLEILKVSSPRERAYFCTIAQSGLRPQTISALKIKDVEGILDDKTILPCKISVRQEATKGAYSEYFSFVGSESVQYIKDYFKTRNEKLTQESFLFTMQGKEAPVCPAVLSHIFLRAVQKLRQKNVLTFNTSRKEMSIKTKDHKHDRSHITRNEIRLYNLRKFFRKFATQAGGEYVNFWMGHTSVLGVDLHYLTKDAEFHRKLYAEKAMPHLRLETSTPSETEKTIEELRQENRKLKEKVDELSGLKGRVEDIEKRMTTMFRDTWKPLTKGTVKAILKANNNGTLKKTNKQVENGSESARVLGSDTE